MNELPTTLLQTLPKFQSVPNLGFSFDVLLGGEPVEIGVIPGGERRRGGAAGELCTSSSVCLFLKSTCSSSPSSIGFYLYFYRFKKTRSKIISGLFRREVRRPTARSSRRRGRWRGMERKIGLEKVYDVDEFWGKIRRERVTPGRWMRDFGGIFGT